MFGIKTKIIQEIERITRGISRGRLSNDSAIKQLMEYFKADEYGHQADVNKADLGYGWIHYGLIRTIKPRRILCVGSRHGYIPAVLAQACKDNNTGFVDFIDPGYGPENKSHWTGVGYWKMEEGKQCFINFGLGKWIKLYSMTTSNFVKKSNKKYDYIYIDGDHSYKGVKLDYQLLWPKLRKYGFIAFHDISVTKKLPEGQYGVFKLWEQLNDKNSVVFPFEGSGLGIIQKI